MNRRDFFKRTFGLAGAVVAAQVIPVEQALSGLVGLVEVELPPNLAVLSDMPGTRKLTLHEIVGLWLNDLEQQERVWPGIRAELGKRLLAQHLGLPWADIRKAIWKILPEDAGADLDGWTHHALIVSEVGKA